MYKNTLSECCDEFSFDWDFDKCMGYVTADDSAASFLSNFSERRYFPNFHMLECVSESNDSPESWMTEDYFRNSLTQCCSDFFSKAISFSYCAWGK